MVVNQPGRFSAAVKSARLAFTQAVGFPAGYLLLSTASLVMLLA